MTVSFGVGTNYLAFTAGSSAAMGSGAFSMFALVKFGGGNNNGGVWGGYNSTTAVRAFGEASNALFGLNDFSGGVGPLTQGTWYIVGITKAAGSAMYRMHFRAQGAGSWTHAVGSGASNQSDGSALTEHRIGFSAVFGGNVDVGWAGLWTSALADASIDTCGTSALQDFASLSPQDLIEFSGWNGTSGHTRPIGTTTLTGATGTNSVGTNPTYNFTVSGGGTAVNVADVVNSGARMLSAGGAAFLGVLAADSANTGLRAGQSVTQQASGLLVVDAPSLIRAPGSQASALTGVLVADVENTGLRAPESPATAVNVSAFPDLDQMAPRALSADGPGVVTGVAVADAPSAVRVGSSAALGAFGLLALDTPGSATRLGASLANVLAGVVVSDTPGLVRWLSATESVLAPVGNPVDLRPLPARWLSADASVFIQQPSHEVPVPPIIVPVSRFRAGSRVGVTRIIVPVEEVRA